MSSIGTNRYEEVVMRRIHGVSHDEEKSKAQQNKDKADGNVNQKYVN